MERVVSRVNRPDLRVKRMAACMKRDDLHLNRSVTRVDLPDLRWKARLPAFEPLRHAFEALGHTFEPSGHAEKAPTTPKGIPFVQT